MKELVQIWSRVTGRHYSSVNQADRELKEFTDHKLRNKHEINTATFEANFVECEGLNSKFNDDLDFNERKDAIINRLFQRKRSGQTTRKPKRVFIILMLGFCALAAGCFVLFAKPYDFIFTKKVTLTDGGEIFEIWRKPEVDLYLRVFLFNVTNAEEYMAGNHSKLILKEVGPYVYKESLEHKVLRFNNNNTLSAVPLHPLTWVEELSEGHQENDTLFLPHIALLSIANVVSKQSMFTRFGLNRLITLTKSQPLMKMTAKEFMMGHKSELMTLGNTFLPGWIYFDKLGLIDRMYDFNGDYETIFTGADNVSVSGLIDTYRGSVDLPQWKGRHCSNVQYASDGTKFKGHVDGKESVLFYRKSLCRAARLVPRKEGIKSGLHGHMYTFEDNLFDNGKYNEDNKCFCREGKCLPPGLLDVSDCYYGFPIALSYPHFLDADPVLFAKVEGLQPDLERHETRLWIEPESGLPLDISAKIQINMALDDISNIQNTEKFSQMVLPLLWFDIRMYALPPAMETRFKFYLNLLPVVEQGAMYLLFVAGVVLILYSVYSFTFKVMFKTFDKTKKQRNILIGTDLWIDKERSRTRNGDKDGVYSPCEIPLNGDTTESDEPQFFSGKRPSFLKAHGDKIKELSLRFGDRVYDSVGSVKGRVRDELTHVKNIFKDEERKNSLIPPSDDCNVNEAYKSDSGDDSDPRTQFGNRYAVVNQSDSEDDCKYLQVVDDGSGFDRVTQTADSDRFHSLNQLDSNTRTDNDDLIIHISD